jgi:ATP-binding cassette subfamily F protein 3
VLGSFGFSGDVADQLVGSLSGGEQTRLALGKVMATPVNLLVLDEPTNHLDLPACDLLEDALIAYPGTVLLVTHDRHLIRSVADALVEVRDGWARWHEGVDERVLGLAPAAAEAAPPRPAAKPASVPKPAAAKAERKRSEAEARNQRHQATKDRRKELARVERAWEAAESRTIELAKLLADPDLYADPERVKAVVAEHEAAKDIAARLMSEWERLSS